MAWNDGSLCKGADLSFFQQLDFDGRKSQSGRCLWRWQKIAL